MLNLLEIESKPYGKIKVSNEQRIYFPEGILGFENLKDYFLLDRNEGPFYWLQSVNIIEVAFVVVNPLYFKAGYMLDLDPADFLAIGLANEKDIEENLLHFVIVTIPPDDPSNMTANLLGPIIINKKTRQGKQALSLNSEYSVRHSILKELESTKQNNISEKGR